MVDAVAFCHFNLVLVKSVTHGIMDHSTTGLRITLHIVNIYRHFVLLSMIGETAFR